MPRPVRTVLLGIVAPLALAMGVPAEQAVFRAMTYNVGSGATIPLGPRQTDRIAQEIVDHRADVVGIAELDWNTDWHGYRDHAAEIGAALAEKGWAMQHHAAPLFEYHGGWMQHALYSRWPVLAWDYHAIPPGKGDRWVVARIEIEPAPGARVQVFMTHIWPWGSDDPARPLRELVDYLNTFEGPRIAMGDFNSTPDGPLYEIVTQGGFTNSCVAANGKPCPSVQGRAGIVAPLPLNAQIDYIWGSTEVTFRSSWVAHTSMSDHWPVVAEAAVDAEGPVRPVSTPHPTFDRRGERMIDEGEPLREAALEAYRVGDWPEAATRFARLADTLPHHAEAPYARYSEAVMRQWAGDDAAAEPLYRTVVERYPDSDWSVFARQRLALLLKAKGDYAEAETWFAEYLEQYLERIHSKVDSPLIEVVLDEVTACRTAAGHAATREGVLADLAEREPAGWIARARHFALAEAARERGDHADAARHYRNARPVLEPLTERTRGKIAWSFLLAGQDDEAVPIILADLNLAPLPSDRRVWLGLLRREAHPERYRASVPRIGEASAAQFPDAWSGVPALFNLDETHKQVLWPGGEAPLAADVWLGWTTEALVMSLRVEDATHHASFTGEELWRGDSVQLALDPGNDGTLAYDDNDVELGAALTPQGVASWVWVGPATGEAELADLAIRREAGETWYRLALPFDRLGLTPKTGTVFRLNLVVNDNDGDQRVAWLDLTPGIAEQKMPLVFYELVLQE